MPFYIYGQDRPGAGAEMAGLTETHWSYMDAFAGRLILRGPTLSSDGEEHTGSVHVVDLADRASAERFATEEPFWLAGLYQQVTAVRTVVLLHREPAKGPPTPEVPSTLVTGHWPPQLSNAGDTGPRLAGAGPDSRVSFLAVLVDDDQSHTTGIVSTVRALPGQALNIVQPLADQFAGQPVALTAQRWQRGGRS
jgi:uncharacterized protein YciI